MVLRDPQLMNGRPASQPSDELRSREEDGGEYRSGPSHVRRAVTRLLLAIGLCLAFVAHGSPATADYAHANREEIIALYQMWLCRAPEAEGAITGRLGRPLTDVEREIKNSPEAAVVLAKYGTNFSGTPKCGPTTPPPPAGHRIKVYVDLGLGAATHPLTADLKALLPQWWSAATRGRSTLEVTEENLGFDVALFVFVPEHYAGWYHGRWMWRDVWYQPAPVAVVHLFAGITQDRVRFAVLHELAHHWCCYGPGSNFLATRDIHWSVCSKATEIVCNDRTPVAQYSQTFSERELAEILR
jgi:hypothetical protein